MHCPACGSRSAPDARFCDQCGSRLDGGLLGVQPGDRRIVTVLFADLVDFSRLVAELDPEEVRRRVDEALGVMADEVLRFGGSLEKFVGDAVFAVFGVPRAHDDDAVRAALSALGMTSALAALPPPPGEPPLRLRSGIASGEVVAAWREIGGLRSLSLTGRPVTAAARLQQIAEPGQILLDGTTVAAAGSRLEATPMGSHRLRGQRGSVAVYRLVAEHVRPAGSRGPLGPLVGREREQALLRRVLAETLATGRGRLVVVRGEAGVGKSRLMADLESDARAAGFGWTWADNVSYGSGQPYRLIRRITEALGDETGQDAGALVRSLLFAPDVDPTVQRRFAGAIAGLAQDASMSGWEAEAALMPRDPAEVVAALREASTEFTHRLAARGPRVLVVDDLHWSDPASLPLIEALARACQDVPIILLIGLRPVPVPSWAEPAATLLELRGLDPQGTARLGSIVAGGGLAPEAASWLHARTDGNPLFVAEIVRALREAGAFAAEDGLLHLAGPIEGPLPVTLRALLGARIDALSPVDRAVLEVASVVGMRVDEPLVAALIDAPATGRALRRLVEAGLLERSPDGTAWWFRHPLFHDAAYAGMLASRRRALHARLADHLEATDPTTPVGLLARHRAAADDPERALPLLERAAEEALALGAVFEAAGFWRAAGDLLAGTDAGEAYHRRARAVRLGDPAGD
ncbi:MAG TPA: AAA family ATPase [Candidatus Limnocylindrales bacterium]